MAELTNVPHRQPSCPVPWGVAVQGMSHAREARDGEHGPPCPRLLNSGSCEETPPPRPTQRGALLPTPRAPGRPAGQAHSAEEPHHV